MRLVQFEILRRWKRDKRGVAAVEAALIAPVAVALLGLIAIWAQAIAIQRKVTLTAHTITDLVSQQGTQTAGACTAPNSSQEASVNQTAVDNILNNAANVLYPYVKPDSGTNPVTGTNMSDMTMVVSEVNVDPSGTTGTVQWSEPMPSHGTALHTTAHAVTLPSAGVGAAGTNVIMGTVTYTYTPPVIGESAGTITLQDTIYLALRQWSCMKLNVGS
jgi:Flp pilus assembly protein TadG